VPDVRERQEELEFKFLSPRAVKSGNLRGRQRPEPPCAVRTELQRDRDRILHCKAFRRLKHKTQVFIAPEGDHYRTRLTHTLEVAQIARTVARALALNEDLTEAIALAHDLGHTAFGHAGEEALNSVHPGGFRHNLQSLRVVDVLENLNLTWEVRNGILHHTGEGLPATLEGQIVNICDRIAYINHDIDDSIRAGILSPHQLPQSSLDILGAKTSSRINALVCDLIAYSSQQEILLSPPVAEALTALREFMFATIYIGSRPKAEEVKAKAIIKQLYRYFIDNPLELPGKNQDDLPTRAVDFIAGMTDRYAINRFKQLFLPSPWQA